MAIISNIHWEKFKIPFRTPIKVGNKNLELREGYFLEVQTQAGLLRSELSPLPGLHSASLEECLKLGKEYTESWKGQDLNTLQKTYPITQRGDAHCALNFCFEALLLDPHSPPYHPQNQVGLFIPGTTFKYDPKFQRIKVKVGRGDLDREIQSVLSLIHSIPDDCLLRLDGNRNLDSEELDYLAKEIPNQKIEFFEEPLKDIAIWFEKFRHLPLAIDESLDNYLSQKEWHCHTLVLKPNWAGGFEEVNNIADEVAKRGTTICLSSSFETPLGLSKISSYQKKNWALPGLGTASYFPNLD